MDLNYTEIAAQAAQEQLAKAKIIERELGWIPAREDHLRTLYARGLSTDDMAAEMGLTRGSISAKISRLGLKRAKIPRKPRNDANWSPERTELLKTLWISGVLTGTIRDQLGLNSNGAVTGKIRRLGLSGRIASTGAISRARRSPEQKEQQAAAIAADAPENRMGPFLPLLSLTSLSTESNQCRNHPWDTGVPGAGFCGQETAPGQSYCPACRPRMRTTRGEGWRAPKVGRIASGLAGRRGN